MLHGFGRLTVADARSPLFLGSGGAPTPLPNSEGFVMESFEDAARQEMVLDVEGVVDGGADRPEPLG